MSMGKKRDIDSGRKDALGRTVRVSGDQAAARADAPPPPTTTGTPRASQPFPAREAKNRILLVTEEPIPPNLMRSTRPLFGREVELDIGLGGFIVDTTDLDEELLQRNRDLDAYTIESVTPDQAIAAQRDYLTNEYGADNEAVNNLSEKLLIDSFTMAWDGAYTVG